MSFLSLTDDEVALLRFTCDLYFVEESPLLAFETMRREPREYEATYHELVKKKVIDPHGFRVTDDALNRIAPVTECDARVVYVSVTPNGEQEDADFYLLDEIAVQYVRGEAAHAFGTDLDAEELVDFLARRMIPRRASGDQVSLVVSATEFAALSAVMRSPRLDDGIARGELRALLGPAPASTSHPATTPMLQVFAPRRTDPTMRRKGRESLSGDPVWDDALAGLVEKGVLTLVNERLGVAARLRELFDPRAPVGRHTVVRYDFGDDEWFMREVTYIAGDGFLVSLAARPDGQIELRDLDGTSLKVSLVEATGPLPRHADAPAAPPPRRAAAPIVDDEDDDATEVGLPPMHSATKVDPAPRDS